MFNVTPVFADYSLLVILIEKEIREMILDINREIRYILVKSSNRPRVFLPIF